LEEYINEKYIIGKSLKIINIDILEEYIKNGKNIEIDELYKHDILNINFEYKNIYAKKI
jgi:hypothetical protein